MGNLPPIGSLERASRQVTIPVEALRTIACHGDKAANEHLKLTGSYSGFDEPSSVKIAREAIEKAYAA